MHIQRLDPAKLEEAYGVKVQLLYPWQDVVAPPFGAAWAVVAPGESTKHHAHQEGETFFFARGRGVMRIGDETHEVQGGDVVYQPPFNAHTLENTSESEDLVFLTVWWEDLDLWARREGQAEETATPDAGGTAGPGEDGAQLSEREARVHEHRPQPEPRRPAVWPARVLVTAAPPTPNGDLHLGHLSGPYLAGDLVARYLRQRGVEARYVFGTDDNQSYVQFKGEQLGLSAPAAADRFAADIAATLGAAEIDLDLLTRPNASPVHRSLVQAFFRRLYDEGKLVEKEAPSPWCEACRRYLFEAHVRGGCPHCGAPTGGNSCEECGRPNDCIDLVDPVCTHCGGTPVPRPFRRLYFPLSRYAGLLREFHQRAGMSPTLRSLCEQVLAAGAPDVAVTHRSDWGIPVPIEGWEGWTIYVWFEMAPRYLAYSHDLDLSRGVDGGWERWWKSDDARVVQCFGFDNGFFYGLLVPALLQAFDAGIRLPEALVMNEFYRLDGRKFSTSRRHAIWGRELIPEVAADVVRFYLAWTCPEVEGTNFTREDFAATVLRELSGSWQGWLAELAARVEEEAGGAVPATGDWLANHRSFYERLRELAAQAAAAYEPRTFSPQQAARTLSELVRVARRFGRAEESWRRVAERGEERRTGIALELLAAKTLAVAAAPLLPEFAARLWRALGYETPLAAAGWEERPSWVPAGQRVRGLAGPWFVPVDALAEAEVARQPAA